jgi:hypothetical protein
LKVTKAPTIRVAAPALAAPVTRTLGAAPAHAHTKPVCAVRMLAALAALAALLLVAQVAHADSNDDNYLHTLAASGITSATGPDALIRIGHAVCDSLSEGFTPSQTIMTLRDNWRGGADHGGLTPSGIPGAVNNAQASAWVTAAVVNYCPTPHPGGRAIGPGPFGVGVPTPGFGTNGNAMDPGAQTSPWPGTGGREFPCDPNAPFNTCTPN